MIDVKKALRLYLITDSRLEEGQDFYGIIEQAVKSGVTMVQLREKEDDGRRLYEKAKKIREITSRYGVPFLVDDRVDIALAVGADGVHVGQKDIPVEAVRRLVPEGFIVGATAATPQLALEAQAMGADYVGSGAMFATNTKQNATSLSLESLQEITRAIDIPVVAIGGIQLKNAALLERSGAAGIAVSSAIMRAEDVDLTVKAFLRLSFGD